MFMALLILFVALSLSAIAAYYSIVGLAAIFASAIIPIVIMGSVLEVAKLTVTVWLHQNWQRASYIMKFYMVPAVLISGYATPVENMPDFLQWVAETNPIRHFIVICKGVFLKDAPLSVVFQHSWPMALIAVVTLSSGAWLFRRRVS